MQKLPKTYEEFQQMNEEEVAAMNAEMTKRAIRNIAIFVGLKVAIAYGIHRWAKSLAKDANS